MELRAGKTLGILIAYMIPGALGFYELSQRLPLLGNWVYAEPSVGTFLYVMFASLAIGLAISPFRWLIVDKLLMHYVLRVQKPVVDFANLKGRLAELDAIVESHFTYYKFYANSFMVVAMYYFDHWYRFRSVRWPVVFIVFEILLLLCARNSLSRHHSRAERILA